MIAEREKLKTTLSQSQDRAFRRMSELREQIQLDQLAKKDLEDNYRLMLEERDEFIKVLQMQVSVFFEGNRRKFSALVIQKSIFVYITS